MDGQNTLQSVRHMQRCEVCHRLTIGTHYGAAVCGSCASFFRRTIGSGKSYQCTCRMPYRNKKKGCRHCRFKNCLKAGMDAKVVEAIKPFPQSNNTLLSQLLACRDRVYVSRGLLLRETEAQRAENAKWREPDLGRGRSYECLSHVEHRGLTQYWSDFLLCVPYFKDCASPTLLENHFLVVWLKLEEVLATVSLGNVEKEMRMCDYETTLPVTYDCLYASRHSTCWFGDLATLATLVLENVSEVLRFSQSVRSASIDNLEITAVIQFLVAYYEREVFVDDTALKKFVNQVLRELHDHYKSTYSKYHERLGVIVSIVGEFHRLIIAHELYSLHLSLFTRSGQGFHLPSQTEADTLHDLRHSVKL